MKTDSKKKLTPLILPLLILAVGVLLLIYMVTVESEPGAIPLLLIIVGTVWFFIKRKRLKSSY